MAWNAPPRPDLPRDGDNCFVLCVICGSFSLLSAIPLVQETKSYLSFGEDKRQSRTSSRNICSAGLREKL
jgi:hypothetical protein